MSTSCVPRQCVSQAHSVGLMQPQSGVATTVAASMQRCSAPSAPVLLPPCRFCRFRNLAQGNHSTERRDYFSCACRDPATQLHWAPDLLCASGPAAAAQDPAVCRVRKLGGGDWQAGTWVNSTCHISDEPFGQGGTPVAAVYNVGGPYKVQLLCAGPASRRRLAAASSAGGRSGRRALGGSRRLAELNPGKTCEHQLQLGAACLHASRTGPACCCWECLQKMRLFSSTNLPAGQYTLLAAMHSPGGASVWLVSSISSMCCFLPEFLPQTCS